MGGGMSWIKLEVHSDDKMELIEAEFGLDGFGVVVKLRQKIGSLGYYIEWTNDVAALFSHRECGGCAAVSEIVKAAVRRGIFDKNLYENYNILTSKKIQEDFFEAAKRRKNIEVKKEYLLVKVDQIPENVIISSKNADISSENVNNFKQRRVEKSREEKSREEENMRSASQDTAPTQKLYGTYKNVLLSDDDMEALKSEFPTSWSKYIERLSEYMASTGKAYKNHLATIRSWAKKDTNTSKNTKKSKFCNYNDTNKPDYSNYSEQILEDMLGEAADKQEEK